LYTSCLTLPPVATRCMVQEAVGRLQPAHVEGVCKELSPLGASMYCNLLWTLCSFHAVMIYRKRFKALGWNVPYDFSNSDLAFCTSELAVR
jgi:hypothetical protein